ncbi:hypothetical protein Cgig2_034208 [Carnegiea gigantea]|uniref:Uncharacterized protein n=1 Tax=Carnegiea gigantea TaxID=171969 RepID=A0A9Q1JLW4_9CARY|nr:hypothetical protein Cgig2_034208 [Carnegiea gigantea]
MGPPDAPQSSLFSLKPMGQENSEKLPDGPSVKRTVEGMSSLRQPLAQGREMHDRESAPHEEPKPHGTRRPRGEQQRTASGVDARQIIRIPEHPCRDQGPPHAQKTIAYGLLPEYCQPAGNDTVTPRFGDKTKSRNLEVDFLEVDMPTAYNVILGRPILYRVKVVIAPYLLQIQYKADNGMVGKLFKDQRPGRECYLISIRPLTGGRQSKRPQDTKKPRVGVTVHLEALVICALVTDGLR